MDSLNELNDLLTAARVKVNALTMKLHEAQSEFEVLERERHVATCAGQTEADAMLLGEHRMFNGG